VNRDHSLSHLYDELNILKLEDIHKLEVAKIMHNIWNKQEQTTTMGVGSGGRVAVAPFGFSFMVQI